VSPSKTKRKPDPASTCRELCAAAEAGELPPLLILHGPARGEGEPWFAEKILDEIRIWARNPADLALLEADGADPDFDPAPLEAFMGSASLFGGRRMMIFSRATAVFKRSKGLAAALASACRGEGRPAWVVLDCPGKVSMKMLEPLFLVDGARAEGFRRLYGDPPPWKPGDLDASEAAVFAVFEARTLGMQLVPGGAGALIQYAGDRPAQILGTLEHLKLLGHDRVGETEVLEVAGGGTEGSASDFAEAVLAGDGAKAFARLDHMRRLGMRTWDGRRLVPRDAAHMALSLLARERGRTRAVADALSGGATSAAALKAGGVPPTGPPASRMQERIRNLKPGRLARILSAIRRAERRIRVEGWQDPLDALEELAFHCHHSRARR